MPLRRVYGLAGIGAGGGTVMRALPLRAAVAAVLVVVAILAVRGATRPRVIHEAESPFGRVRVEERSDGLRALYTGDSRARQTALYPGRPGHLELAYTRVAMIGLALAPAERPRLLFVGLGGGAMPRYARHVLPDAVIDAVEIDPEIVAVARSLFGFEEDDHMVVHTGDGRAFIEAAPPGSWDVIFLDAFSESGIPFALTTREFLESVRGALAPDGAVVSNLWSSMDEYDAMLATYAAVFGSVHTVRVPHRTQRIVIAGGAVRSASGAALTAAARSLSARADLGFDLPALVEGGYEGVARRSAEVLTDSAVAR